MHNSASTEHLSYEMMARLFYTPNRYVADWLQVPASQTALNDDVVGFTRTLSLYAKEADIDYVFLGRNGAVNAFENLNEEAAFYWNPPDKDTKRSLFKVFGYYSPDKLQSYDTDEIASLLHKYESKNNYPYHCILAEESYDFSVPGIDNVEGIKKWNNQYSNPVIISGTFDMYFNDLAMQEELRPFVEFDKDVPNSWSDEDYSDAKYAGKAHNLGNRLPEVEKLATISQTRGAGRYPWEEIYMAYNRLLMFAEHTLGAYAEGPIYVPKSLKDSAAANATYYECEQQMHRALVDEAEMYMNKAANSTFNNLNKLITSKAENSLIVFNSLNCKRTDIVTFLPPVSLSDFKIIDNKTQNEVPYQRLRNDSIIFIAENIPSVGYKTFSLISGHTDVSSTTTLCPNHYIENEYYKITVDPNTGIIKSIYDKELNKELVDQDAEYGFNEYIYQKYESRSYEDGVTEYRTESATSNCYRGELLSIIESDVQANGCESVKQIIKLYKGIKRIDFELQLKKSHSERTLELYRQSSAKNKEGLFYAFPFNIPDFTIRHELPGGVVEPVTDQSAGSSTDYYGIQNYSSISNKDYGIVLSVSDLNLIEYGAPRVAPWGGGADFESILKKPENPYIFLYLANNMFFTNMRQSQHGNINFRWQITSHKNDWKQGEVYKSGWKNTHPLIPILSSGKRTTDLPEAEYSFLTLDVDNVICSTIKPAEANGEGYILRFFEQAGKQTTVEATISFGFPLEAVVETNLLEDDRSKKISLLSDSGFRFNISAYGLKTIRVIPKASSMHPVNITDAIATADREVILKWENDKQGLDDIAYFKLYRSKEPEFNPSFRYYIGSTEKCEYTDVPVLNYGGWMSYDIKPATTYYYKVVPVGKNNRIYKPSNTVKVTTKNSNERNLPPGKVHGLYVVHVSDIAPFNYNALFFYTNIEDDVTKYRIYRSQEKGFEPSDVNLISEFDADNSFEHVTPHAYAKVNRKLKEYNRQLYVDQNVEDRVTYYYKVCAVDEAGNMGAFSDEVEFTPQVMFLDVTGNRSFAESSVVGIIPEINPSYDIRYTLDGSDPDNTSKKYTNPFTITENTTIKAGIFKDDKIVSASVLDKAFYKSNNYEVTYNIPYSRKWPSTGDYALVDNVLGEYYADGWWQGFEGDDMDLVIDLKEMKTVSQIIPRFLNTQNSWIFLPEYVEVFVSADGENYISVGRIETDEKLTHSGELIYDYSMSFPSQKVRYVKVFAKNMGICPEWHAGFGGKAWIFADEILIK